MNFHHHPLTLTHGFHRSFPSFVALRSSLHKMPAKSFAGESRIGGAGTFPVYPPQSVFDGRRKRSVRIGCHPATIPS
jgi:hypothetical protein